MVSREERIARIQSYQLDLPPGDYTPVAVSTTAGEKDPSAAVDGGSGVSFVGGVEGLDKQDVLNSTLFAQLVANKAYNRQTDTDNWYKQYKEVLETLGWLVTSFTFSENGLSNTSVAVEEVVIEYLQASLTTAQLAAIYGLLEFLRKRADNDPYVNLFTTESSYDKQSNFQLGAVALDRGDLVFTIGAFFYSLSTRVTNVLFTKIKRGDAKFFNANQTMILNRQLYAEVREEVLKKLGNNAKEKIKEWEI